jgi:hypothetical protein
MVGSDIARLPGIVDLIREFGIAELTGFVPIHLLTSGIAQGPTNRVDAAFARIISSKRDVEHLSWLPSGSRIQGVAGPYDIDIDTGSITGTGDVYKVGRSSGYTEGYVSNVGAVVNVEFANGTAILSIKS